MCPNVLTSEKKNVPPAAEQSHSGLPVLPQTHRKKMWQPEFNHALWQQRLQQWGAGGLGLVTRTTPAILYQVCGKPVVFMETSFPFVSIGCFVGRTFVFIQTSKWSGAEKWGHHRQDFVWGKCCVQPVLQLLWLESSKFAWLYPWVCILSCVFS